MTTMSTCRPSCAAESIGLLASTRHIARGDTGNVSVRIRRVTTTRAGGVSAPPFDTFNLGDHVGDDPAAVAANRARLAAAIGLPGNRVVWMNQVHGDRVELVDQPRNTALDDTDGLVTATPRLALAVVTADCVPVLMADARAGIAAAVHSARVQRQYPSALRITIVERVPVVVKDFSDGPHLFDRDGVDFATDPPPPALPYFDVDNPGPSDPTTKAALQVLTALHPEVASQVGRIAAPSVASITLTLADGRVVIWGTTDRCEEKAEKLAALLTQPGRTYDVSSPDLPTVK